MDRKYDLIIFGASGFTGKYCIEETVKFLKIAEKDNQGFTWAVAGRNISKLKDVLQSAENATGHDMSSVDKIIADVKDVESLKNMAKLCKVVVNCVGPYSLYGEPVVQACIQEKTHHIDLSGEANFLEKIQLKYHDEAEKAGSYIVGACGFDSIPNDMGIEYLKQKFDGRLNSVEAYVDIHEETMPQDMSWINFGTFFSLVQAMSSWREMFYIRKVLFPKPLPEPNKTGLKVSKKVLLHYNKEKAGWYLPIPGPDGWVIDRTQRYFYENEGQRPIQTQVFMKQPGFFKAVFRIFAGIFIFLLAQFSIGRSILENHPEVVTGGLISKKGPRREDIDKAKVTFDIVGYGWKSENSDKQFSFEKKHEKKMTLRIHGKNPGYGLTNICLLASAFVIIHESDKLPKKGGVYTPGVAFSKTSIMSVLKKHGITVELGKEEQIQ